MHEGSEKGSIPNGSLFSDAKHCLDHSVTSAMLNCFTPSFYYRVKQTNEHIVNVKYNRLLKLFNKDVEFLNYLILILLNCLFFVLFPFFNIDF